MLIDWLINKLIIRIRTLQFHTVNLSIYIWLGVVVFFCHGNNHENLNLALF